MDENYTLFYLFNNFQDTDNELFTLNKLLKEDEKISKLMEKVKYTPRKSAIEKILNFSKLVTTTKC